MVNFISLNMSKKLFNDLYESDKKIIITCNKEPDKFNNIEPRIITRL